MACSVTSLAIFKGPYESWVVIGQNISSTLSHLQQVRSRQLWKDISKIWLKIFVNERKIMPLPSERHIVMVMVTLTFKRMTSKSIGSSTGYAQPPCRIWGPFALAFCSNQSDKLFVFKVIVSFAQITSNSIWVIYRSCPTSMPSNE